VSDFLGIGDGPEVIVGLDGSLSNGVAEPQGDALGGVKVKVGVGEAGNRSTGG